VSSRGLDSRRVHVRMPTWLRTTRSPLMRSSKGTSRRCSGGWTPSEPVNPWMNWSRWTRHPRPSTPTCSSRGSVCW